MTNVFEKILLALRSGGAAVIGCGEQVSNLRPSSSVHTIPGGMRVRLDWEQVPTPEQLGAVDASLLAIDLADKERKEVAELLTEVGQLQAGDRTKLVNAVVADYIRRFPDFAKKVGVAIDGEKSSKAKA